ncbi:MAG TPA: nitroreductase/quinone reductase family protein, partial [Ktedonobacteraceae bacterium]|nr:nitroreductase/quinone reductase family protein [Ktedonobacteraceae bacterium]
AGGARNPGWFFNLRDNPRAVIQVRDKQINVVAEVADKEKKRELWARLVAKIPSYETYQQKTTREFPMAILHPVDESAP